MGETETHALALFSVRIGSVRTPNRIHVALSAFALLALAGAYATGQQRGGGGGQEGPAPRLANGRVSLMANPGQAGIWLLGGGSGSSGTGSPVPYQAWTRAISADRGDNWMEPHTRCKPSGGIRQFLTPYGVEFIDLPELQRVYIMDIGGPHTFRVIYMDAKTHPADLEPTYYGHSIGRWEKDTLIVDTVGFNERFWIDRGQFPHTEQLRVVEKFTRTSSSAMTYEYTIEDPGAYTAPFSRSASFSFRAGSELFEYICQDNNEAPELLVGTLGKVDRSSLIIP